MRAMVAPKSRKFVKPTAATIIAPIKIKLTIMVAM